MENVLAAFLAFRDSLPEDEYFKIRELNEKLDELMEALDDLAMEEEV